MQIMPPVGRELARKVPVRGFRTSQLTSPETNIRIGTYYFRRLLDSCDGKLEDALAAYNAGRSRVTLWRGWGPFEDSHEFAETIPFAQTRDYVQIILRNMELYRWLYASEPVAGPVAGDEEPAVAETVVNGAASASKQPASAGVETSGKPAASATSISQKSSKSASAASKKPKLNAPAAKKKRRKHPQPQSS
jgi:soluble lytic murein transglycosylase